MITYDQCSKWHKIGIYLSKSYGICYCKSEFIKFGSDACTKTNQN